MYLAWNKPWPGERKESIVKRRALLLFAVATCVGLAGNAHAQAPAASADSPSAVRIQSDFKGDTRMPIAVPPCAVLDPTLAKLASDVAQVVADDLTFTGLFKVTPPNQFPVGFAGLPTDPNTINLDTWAGTEMLVYGMVAEQGGMLVCQFRLFDIKGRQQLLGQELRVEKAHPRLASHKFSEEIVRVLESTPGSATSEIFFTCGPTGKKELYVSDYDGANMKQLTKHGSISIKPKVSPDGNRIAYISYKDRYPFLYVYDRRTGVSSPLSKEVGLNSSPAWSPKGNRIAMTLSKDGNTEIYLRDPDGRNPVRLTRDKGGDTQPCFSPDGSKIVFVSDRGGNPQIYTMGADGSNQSRISHQGGNAYDPSWSPDGNKIAFTVEKKGEGFQIWTMSPDGTGAMQMTTSGTNESPSWSPDSRHILFMRSGQLWTVNATTGEARQVPRINQNAEGPNWGPRRQ